jgi:hypothetical protein
MTAKKKLQSPALRFTYDRTVKGKPERRKGILMAC